MFNIRLVLNYGRRKDRVILMVDMLPLTMLILGVVLLVAPAIAMVVNALQKP